MGQKQMSFGIQARLHGLLQFAAKDRKLRRSWPWKQKEIAALALVEWIVEQAQAAGLRDKDLAEVREEQPQPPEQVEPGGDPLLFDLARFKEGTGTLSFKLPKAVETRFERVCLAVGSKKGKAVAKALRGWLARNGYEAQLAALDVRGA